MSVSKVVMAQSKMDGNVWYIFREDGTEVEVSIVNNKINSSTKLSLHEINHVREKALNKWGN